MVKEIELADQELENEIAKRQRAEARFWLLVEAIPNALVMANHDEPPRSPVWGCHPGLRLSRRRPTLTRPLLLGDGGRPLLLWIRLPRPAFAWMTYVLHRFGQ